MRRIVQLIILLLIPFQAISDVRIKDIVNVEGVRDNVLVGYGLVVGLNGTGDNMKNSVFTEKGLTDFLEKLGINTRGSELKTKNVAAVMVTANLPPFSRIGSRIDVNVSTIGDAKSLKGGTLLATTLLGADGEVYAIAQGKSSIGSLGERNATNVVPTTGYVTKGATVEKEIDFNFNDLENITIALKNPDITTARAITNAINSAVGHKAAHVNDPGTIKIAVPEVYLGRAVAMIADVENLRVAPDRVAKIIIDEATDTIVIGDNVKISPVAVAQKNLVVQVQEERGLAADLGLAPAEGKTLEPGKGLAVIEESANLKDLVNGLNALGVSPKELVAILTTIQKSGALQASIEVR